MPSYAMLTNVGRNKEAAALASGVALEIAELGWGDGTRIPAGGEIALENEQGRKPIAAQGVTSGAINTAFFEVLLAEHEGPFVIQEAGLFDVDGDMIAVAYYDPPVNKPLNTVSAHLRINVVFSDLQNLIIQIDASTAFVPATREIIAGDGLTGGGNLNDDRTLSLDFATQAESLAGTRTDKPMSPLRVSEAITQAIEALIAGAPDALDTLQELATALADDDNAIAALTASLATKLNAADYTAADVISKLLSVDGAGSVLDADKLDGLHAASFVQTTRSITAGAGLTGGGALSSNRTLAIDAVVQNEAIKNRLYVNITYDPDASAADLSHGGVFRTWVEFAILNDALPHGAYVSVYMNPDRVLEVTTSYSPIHGHRHWRFISPYVAVAGARPLIRLMSEGVVGSNRWRTLEPGLNGTVTIEYVDVEFEDDYEPGAGWDSYGINVVHQDASRVHLERCQITGPERCVIIYPLLAPTFSLSLYNVDLVGLGSGLGRSLSTGGCAMLGARNVTLADGALLYDSSWTVGTDLLVGQQSITTVTS